MLSALASLVDPKAANLQGLPAVGERTKTVGSTAETDEVLLEQLPFLVDVCAEEEAHPLGITVSFADDPGCLTIDDVRSEGLIVDWNASHGEELMVRPGHVIISVNGTADSAQSMLALISSLKKGVPLELVIQPGEGEEERKIVSIDGSPKKTQRRGTFYAQLRPRQGMPLGLAVSLDDDPRYVSIDGISAQGLISEWNLSQDDEELRVHVGDGIASVNRCSDDGRQMLRMLTQIQNVNSLAVLELGIAPSLKQRRSRTCRARQIASTIAST